MSADLPAPRIDADSRPYWEGARAGRLLLQRCGDCGTLRFYPRRLCPECWSEAVEWVEASGRGKVHSFSIVHRAPAPAFRARLPYVIALVDLAEGPRMMANIVGPDALGLRIGDKVAVVFEERAEGAKVPQFRLVHE